MIIGITGSKGNLGKRLIQHSSGKFMPLECDLLNGPELINEIKIKNPDIIIHCAAKTNPDWCEKNIVSAYTNNLMTTERLCKVFPGKIIYITSDWVYDGNKDGNFSEENIRDILPINTYASTKLLAEKVIFDNKPNSLVIRTSGLFDINTPLIRILRERIQQERPVCGSTKRIYNPTYIPHLVNLLNIIIERDSSGIINLCGHSIISEEEFVRQYCMILGYKDFYETGKTLLTYNCKIPEKLGLNIEKANRLGLPKMHYIDGIIELIKEIHAK